MIQMPVQAEWWEQYKVDLPPGKHGNVELRPIVIDEQMETFSSLRAMLHDGRGRVKAGTYTGLYRQGGLWMSDTPDEIADHMDFLHMAEAYGGAVLVNGLGLGMVVKALLAMPQVTHVDVVDIDPDVVALVGPAYEGERCTVHLADAYKITWPRGTSWTCAWHDIWQDISPDNLSAMRVLRRKYARRALYQECWSEQLAIDIDIKRRAERKVRKALRSI